MVSLSLDNPTAVDSYSVPFPIRRFSVEEYESMACSGVLDEDDNVELLEGWIVPKMTNNPFHECVISLLQHVLGSRVTGYHVRVQCAISTSDSEPEPDLAVVRGVPQDYRQRHPHPADIALIIEVADSSLARDFIKRRIYARAGINHYWIVNLPELCVEVYCNPVGGDPVGAADAHYQTGLRYSPEDTIEATLADDLTITLPVSDFLTRS